MTNPSIKGDLTAIVGENILQLRKYLRITQKELGDAIGHTKSSIHQIEKGHVSTRIDNIEMIAYAFGIEPQVLFRKEGYLDITRDRQKHPMLRTRDEDPGA